MLAWKPTLVAGKGISKPYIGVHMEVSCQTQTSTQIQMMMIHARVKIPPPIFKGLPGERPDAHIYATEDWMEAMHFREDQYIDKFKHTLNHLAQEWYHSLDRDTFHGDWGRVYQTL